MTNSMWTCESCGNNSMPMPWNICIGFKGKIFCSHACRDDWIGRKIEQDKHNNTYWLAKERSEE